MNDVCRVCSEAGTVPLWEGWRRCLVCGSDTGPRTWDEVKARYNRDFIVNDKIDTEDVIQKDMDGDLDWFQHHGAKCPDRTFLDIGCCEGAGLRGMARRGWSTHGFDIIPEAKDFSPPGKHITIANRFAANLFPRRYSAVMAREVFEHVPGWREFLYECWHVTMTNGLFLLRTPRPTVATNPAYTELHLQLHAPLCLRYWLERIGFDVIEMRLWDVGQAFLCRRPN